MIVAAGSSDHPVDFQFERRPGLPYWTIGYRQRGRVLVASALGSDWIETGPHSLFLARPDSPYRTRMAPGSRHWQGSWLLFTPRAEWEALLQWPEPLPGIGLIAAADAPDRRELQRAAQAAVERFRSPSPHAALQAMHALEELLLRADVSNPSARQARLDPRVCKAAALLAQDLDQPLDLAAVAAELQISPSRLAHRFRAEIGEAPMRYRERLRLQQAQQLLLGTGMSIAAIAEAVGYQCPFHFSKRFKHVLGLAPRHWLIRQSQWVDRRTCTTSAGGGLEPAAPSPID